MHPRHSSLKLLTYNIHKGFSAGNGRFVLRQIREALGYTAADLVCLQEIQGEHARRQRRIGGWPDETQIEYLAAGTWPHHAYGKNAVYEAGHHGNAILSKHPISDWENINVANSRLASRSVLHAVIELPGGAPALHVICIHFGLTGPERRRQFTVLRQRVLAEVPQQAPLVIAGDFNDWNREAEWRMRAGLGVQDVFVTLNQRPANTYPAWYPVLPVDRIFYRGVRPLSCRCLKDMPWRRLSDHAPLLASFAVEKPPQNALALPAVPEGSRRWSSTRSI